MSNPDYPAFRRYLDNMVEFAPDAVHLVERAEGENVYVLPEVTYNRLKNKADKLDRIMPRAPSPEDAEEAEIIKEFLEGNQS